ncbi:MAG TPA: hypothetical protein VGJ91_14935, partial [Polyangiaceae bacterium]
MNTGASLKRTTADAELGKADALGAGVAEELGEDEGAALEAGNALGIGAGGGGDGAAGGAGAAASG